MDDVMPAMWNKLKEIRKQLLSSYDDAQLVQREEQI